MRGVEKILMAAAAILVAVAIVTGVAIVESMPRYAAIWTGGPSLGLIVRLDLRSGTMINCRGQAETAGAVWNCGP